MKRRQFLLASGALGAARLLPAVAADSSGEPQAFDYAWLKGHARALAKSPRQPQAPHLPEALHELDWDRYQSIRFRPERALWAESRLRFRLQFFHLGLFYDTPVRLFEVAGGMARRISYDRRMFDLARAGLDGARLPPDLGFAGFRVLFHIDWRRDLAAFLGASYFRAVGADMQYGLSARGLAVDSGLSRPEEFPAFTAFWFERPQPENDRLTFYALLDSDSVTGAYRFDLFPGATLIMEVAAALYPRQSIERLGVAPLTSMFLRSANDKRVSSDWRPQIHDSDGLSLWTGSGERLWRPLTNPARLRFNAYQDENPRGFGLLQRDRNFDHYQDDGAFYNLRPSLWVEPLAGWGKGSVQLVELPAPDETEDNIVAFWNPEVEPKPGMELLFAYRLHWGASAPFASPLAQVVATRTGIGGVVGRRRNHLSWRFVVDFAGGPLAMVGDGTMIEPVITASRGVIELPSARPLAPIHGYRAMFDLRPEDASSEPINLRLHLAADGQALSETWLYQWTPPVGG